MPILDVTVVPAADDRFPAGLAQLLADAAGQALHSPSGETWVRLHVLSQDRYAENSGPLSRADLPVFVVILAREMPQPAQLIVTTTLLTRAIAQTIGRPMSNVHIEFSPGALGRVSFGGNVVE